MTIIKILLVLFAIFVLLPVLLGAIAALFVRGVRRLRATRDWQFTDYKGQVWTVKGKPLFGKSKNVRNVKVEDENINVIYH